MRRRRPGRLLPNPSPSRTHKLTRSLLSARLARAMTRNCRPRHERRDERGPSSTARRAAAVALPTPLSTPEEAALGAALVRLDVRLYGAPWCDKCREQKQMLFRMLGPRRWRDRYVDCASAQCCLGCAGVGSVPMWKVDGRRYLGRMDRQAYRYHGTPQSPMGRRRENQHPRNERIARCAEEHRNRCVRS